MRFWLARAKIETRVAIGCGAVVCAGGLVVAATAVGRATNPTVSALLLVSLVVLAVAVAVFVACRAMLTRELHALNQLSAAIESIELDGGTICRNIPAHGPAEIERVVAAWNGFALRFDELMQTMRERTNALAAGTHELQTAVPGVENDVGEQVRLLQDVASRVRRAVDATATVRRRAESTTERAKATKLRVQEALQQATEIGATMAQFATAAKSTEGVLQAMDGMAFQANLLALNAAIAAADAGERGKGFATVAVEVRALAAKSTAATRANDAVLRQSAQASVRGQQLAEQLAALLAEAATGLQDLHGEAAALLQDMAAQGDEVVFACARSEDGLKTAERARGHAADVAATVLAVTEAAAGVEACIWPSPEVDDCDVVALATNDEAPRTTAEVHVADVAAGGA